MRKIIGIRVKGNHVIQVDTIYAYSAQTKTGQDLIKLIENTTGRIELIQRAGSYNDVISKEKSFWNVIIECYDLNLDSEQRSLDNITHQGSLILIANHP